MGKREIDLHFENIKSSTLEGKERGRKGGRQEGKKQRRKVGRMEG